MPDDDTMTEGWREALAAHPAHLAVDDPIKVVEKLDKVASKKWDRTRAGGQFNVSSMWITADITRMNEASDKDVDKSLAASVRLHEFIVSASMSEANLQISLSHIREIGRTLSYLRSQGIPTPLTQAELSKPSSYREVARSAMKGELQKLLRMGLPKVRDFNPQSPGNEPATHMIGGDFPGPPAGLLSRHPRAADPEQSAREWQDVGLQMLKGIDDPWDPKRADAANYDKLVAAWVAPLNRRGSGWPAVNYNDILRLEKRLKADSNPWGDHILSVNGKGLRDIKEHMTAMQAWRDWAAGMLIDPFSQKPFISRDGLQWSVGPNGKDDGGAKDDLNFTSDIAFRMQNQRLQKGS